MVDEFLGPLRELVKQHAAARDAAAEAARALRNQPDHAELRSRVSKAHARLVSEHEKLATILGAAKAAQTRAAQAELDSLEALMPPPDVGIGLPQPEDLGFDVEVDFEDSRDPPPEEADDFSVDVGFDDAESTTPGWDISAEPTHPGHPAPAAMAPPGPAAPAGLDDILQSFVSDEGPPPSPAPKGGGKQAWLDAMLSDFVNDDPFRGKRVRGTARLRRYQCKGLVEVQLAGLITHAPRGLDELVRLSNIDEDSVRTCVETFIDRGLVELI